MLISRCALNFKVTSLSAVRIFCLLLIATFVFSNSAFAVDAPQGLNLQGRIVKPDGQPVEGASVNFTIQIRSPGTESCVLYEETHTLNMSLSDGMFNLRVGEGSRGGGNYEDTSTLAQVFNNASTQINSLTCGNGDTDWDPGPGDARKLHIVFDDGSGAGPQALAQDQVIQAVPYALNSDHFGGKQTSDFVQTITALELVPGTTQSRFEQIFNTDYTGLQALLAGTSTLYAKAVPTAAVSNNGQRFTNVADPTAAQDAATKNYSDTKIGGNTANLGTLVAGDANKVVMWNGTQFVAQAIPADSTKLSLSGGTMTGAINMGGQNITAAGHVQLSNQATLLLGRYDNGQEATLVSGLAAADKGRTWFNTDTNKVRYWTGAAASDVGAGTVTSVSGTAPVQVATGTTTPVISVDDATGASKGIMQVGTGLSVASGVVSVAFGDVDNTAVEADSIPNCTAVQKLQRSLGPTFSWSCVADDTGSDTGMTALTGDVTALGSGSQAATIANDAVTYAKMQNVTTNKLMGRATAGAGDMEEITLGTALSYTGTTLNVTESDPTVTAFAKAALPTCGAGQILKSDGTSLSCVADDNVDASKVAKAGDTMTGTLVLPANGLVAGTDQLVIAGGNVGIGVAAADTKLQVAGTIRVGDGGESCAGGNFTGGIRYNSGAIQFCNGTSWQTLGVSGAGIVQLSGDVTTAGAGAGAATIANDVVTFAKMQNIATNKLLGRATAGSGDTEEITLGTALSYTGTTLNVTEADPTVTAFAKAALPTCGAGQVLKGDGTSLSCVADSTTDSTKVAKAGDTMTGTLNLPADGLVAGTTQLVLSGGNVGIGTASPSSKLTVSGGITSSGAIIAASGSAASPAFIVGGSGTGTGMYYPAANSLGFSTGTSEKMRIDSAGNVGIGITNPDTKLQVAGTLRVGDGGETCASGNFTGGIRYNGGNIQFCNGTAWTTLGTGTGSGDFKSDGSVSMTGPFKAANGDATTPGIMFASDADTGFYSTGGNSVYFTAGGTARFRFISTGITSESNGSFVLSSGTSAGNPSFTFVNNNDTGMYRAASDTLGFSTAGTEKLRVHSGGGVRLAPSALPGTPANGDLAIDSGDGNKLKYYNGSWQTLTSDTGITQLTGDVTTAAGSGAQAATIAANAVTTAKIADDAVTFAKMQNINTARILGRTTASSGDVEEISAGAGITLASGSLSVAFGDVDGTAVEADSIPHCTAAEKLERSAGPTFAWSCVTDVDTVGGLANFTESVTTAAPNATVPVVRFLATDAATDVDVALSPKGTGALLAHVPTSTSAGGNKRGQYAVDWQTNRSNANQVASGNYSVVSGGNNNKATATNSTVSGGGTNTASAVYATVGGGQSVTASGEYSFATGRSTTADSYGQATFGMFNMPKGSEQFDGWVTTDPLFVVGNGTGGGASRSTALMLLKNGNLGLGVLAPDVKLQVNGTLRVGDGGETCSGGNFTGGIRYNGGNIQFCNGTAWTTLGTGSGSGDFLANGTVPMTGTLEGKDGTAASPSFAFDSDPTTGLFRNGAGDIGFSVGGSLGFRILGASTAYMSAGRLRMENGAAATPAYGFHNDNDTGFWTPGSGSIGVSSDSSEVFRFHSNGVRLAPKALPGTPANGDIAIDSGDGNKLKYYNGSWQTLTADSNKVAKAGDTMTGTLNLPANGLVAGTDQLVLSGGNVGVGTASPGFKFEVQGSAYMTDVSTNQVSITQAGAAVYPSNIISAYTTTGQPQVSFQRYRGTGTTSPVAVNDGDVSGLVQGLAYNGTQLETSSGVKLLVDGTDVTGSGSHPGGRIDFVTRGTSATGQYSFAATPAMTIRNSGNVGIGITTPDVKLQVAGTIRVGDGGETCSGGNFTGGIRYNGGNIQFCNGTAWTTLGTGGGSGDFKADGTVPMTGVFEASLGLEATPSITFDGDENTGFYRPAADRIGFVANGNEVMRLSASALSSQGTNSWTLNSGNSVTGPAFGFNNDTNSGMYWIAADTFGFTSGGTERMRILSGGGVRLAPAALPGTPANGDIAIDSGDGNKLKYYNGSWQTLTSDTGITQLTGDVTAGAGSGSQAATIAANAVTTAKIADDAVTFAKMQDINTARILGRTTAAAGDVEEISAGAGITLASGSLAVNFGDVDGTAVEADSIPHCTAAQKLERSAGPTFSWSCVTDVDTNGGGDFKADGSVAMTNTLTAAAGTTANPGIVFSSDADSGFYAAAANTFGIVFNGTDTIWFSSAWFGFRSSGPILQSTNSATSPAFSSKTDTNTGMYFPAADTLAFTNGGSEKVRIDSSGNVGIGTTSPSAAVDIRSGTLQVKGTSNNLQLVREDASNSAQDIARLRRSRSDSTAPSNAMAGVLAFELEGFTNSDNARAASIYWGWENNQTNDTTDRDSYMAFRTMADAANESNSGDERMRITSAGNVGIGTTSPTGILQVTGGTAAASTSGTNITLAAQNAGTGNMNGGNIVLLPGAKSGTGTNGGVLIGSPTVGSWLPANSLYATGNLYGDSGINTGSGSWVSWGDGSSRIDATAASSTGYMRVTTAGSERVRIDASGNVGIGTTSPNQILTVEGVTSFREVAASTATANYGKLYVKSSDSHLYFMDDSGNEYDLTVGTAPKTTFVLAPTQGVGASTTQYSAPSAANFATAETGRIMVMTSSGTLSKFYMRTNTAQPASGTLTCTVRKNQGDEVSLQIVLNANDPVGTYSDTTGSVSFVEGDLFSVGCVNTATATSAVVTTMSFLFTY